MSEIETTPESTDQQPISETHALPETDPNLAGVEDVDAFIEQEIAKEKARTEALRLSGGLLNDFHKGILAERAIRLDIAVAAGLQTRIGDTVEYRQKRRKYKLPRSPEAIEDLEGEWPFPMDSLFQPYQRDHEGHLLNYRLRYDNTTFPTWSDEMDTSGVSGGWIDAPCPRYQSKPGVPVCPYIPGLFDSAEAKQMFVFSDDDPLFVSEAPLKCLSLYSHGYKGIGLGGVLAGCHEKRADKRLKVTAHPEMKRVNWHGRRVYTVFDAGQTTNPMVALGVAYCWQALSGLGAEVYTVTIPARAQGKTEKERDQGPDDFLAKEGRAAFQGKVDAAYQTDPIERVMALASLGKAERMRGAVALGRDLVFRACLSLLDTAGLKEVASVGKRIFTQKDLKDIVSSFRSSMKPKEANDAATNELELEKPSNADFARVFITKIASERSPSLSEVDPLDRVVGDLGSVWAYSEKTGVWEELDENLLSKEIQAMDGIGIKGTDQHWYVQSTGSVLEMIHARVDRPRFFRDRPTGKGFRNGFAVPVDGEIVLKPHSPENKVRHAYDFDYIVLAHDTRLPMTSEYLCSALRGTEDVQEKIHMLGAHAGLCILGLGTWINAAIVLFDNGTGGTGKSVWLELVGAMFFEGLKTAISPQQMCDGGPAEYYRDSMARADINILSEVPSSELVGGDFIKGIFDGNLTSCRAPCGRPYFCSMHLGQLYSCNGMFAVREPTQAFFDRFILVELKNRFRRTEGDKGKDYWKTIRDAELPQLIACCLSHAARVLDEGTFRIPASCQKALEDWRQGCNAVEQFLAEERVPLAEERHQSEGTNKDALWVFFKEWCDRTKQSQKMGRKVFWQRLTALVGEPTQYRTHNAYPFRLRRPEERVGLVHLPEVLLPNVGVDEHIPETLPPDVLNLN